MSDIAAIVLQLKAAVDNARARGVDCEYPETLTIHGERYSFERALICFPQSHIITRVMDDGIKTQDGLS